MHNATTGVPTPRKAQLLIISSSAVKLVSAETAVPALRAQRRGDARDAALMHWQRFAHDFGKDGGD
jgi:hypothetical protein